MRNRSATLNSLWGNIRGENPPKLAASSSLDDVMETIADRIQDRIRALTDLIRDHQMELKKLAKDKSELEKAWEDWDFETLVDMEMMTQKQWDQIVDSQEALKRNRLWG